MTLFCAAALAGLTACDADPVEREGGKLPDKDGLENTYGMLRSTRSVRDEVRVFLTEGNGFVPITSIINSPSRSDRRCPSKRP